MRIKLTCVICAIILTLSCLILSACDKSNSNEVSSVASGEESKRETSLITTKLSAKNFTVTDKDGNTVELDDKKGKPIVVNFWASWCPPCRSEMPNFQSVYATHGKDVEFMMVNLTDGHNETVEKAKKYIADNGFTFPVYFDTLNNASRTYMIGSIPLTLFIDEYGQLVKSHVGALTKDDLHRYIHLITG